MENLWERDIGMENLIRARHGQADSRPRIAGCQRDTRTRAEKQDVADQLVRVRLLLMAQSSSNDRDSHKNQSGPVDKTVDGSNDN
jgi:hypothetical protein